MERDMFKDGIRVRSLKSGKTKTLYLIPNRFCELVWVDKNNKRYGYGPALPAGYAKVITRENNDYNGEARILTILRDNTEQQIQIMDYKEGYGMRLIDKIKRNPEQLQLYYDVKNKIENDSRLTIKEKIIVETVYGVWTGECYSVEEICRMFDLSQKQFAKIWHKAMSRTYRCRCGGYWI